MRTLAPNGRIIMNELLEPLGQWQERWVTVERGDVKKKKPSQSKQVPWNDIYTTGRYWTRTSDLTGVIRAL